MPQLTPASLKIHLLDVGTVKYGDCLVCELGDRRILIDGAHPGDYQGRDGRPSIPEQFEEIFGHAAPFSFDLLVVTHCHSDHIGCLPTLVEEQTIEARWALVADENLGFGHVAGSASPNDALSDAGKLAALLREEDYSHLPDDQLDQMIEDLVNLESRYQGMLTALARAGTKIVRYGTDDHRPVETAFRDFGLKILGPSREHLKICARAIAASNGQAANDIARTADADLVSIHRSILGQAHSAGAEDRPGKGAALK